MDKYVSTHPDVDAYIRVKIFQGPRELAAAMEAHQLETARAIWETARDMTMQEFKVGPYKEQKV